MEDFSDLTAFIDRQGGELVTDSRAVALAFGKKHLHILRTIRAMHNSTHPEIARHYQSNFGLVDFVDAKGERRPMYRMTAKGLSELAMSFSGERARVIRIRFLNAFEAVAERERTITEMLFELERRELPSKAKGQIGSKLMNERRVEKRDFGDERAALLEKAQPGLFLN